LVVKKSEESTASGNSIVDSDSNYLEAELDFCKALALSMIVDLQ
jgi:hypothetical protein